MPTGASAEGEGRCEECGSGFVRAHSGMAALCAECAHVLYGYPACGHVMVAGRCATCGWDGSRSAYVRGRLEGR
ncbi:MAG: hypothetical protein IPK12_24725 [Gemmatimonadetes bacterium]|nr:hypothetical protein [Gemmatimonadota bacterium]